MTNNKTLDQIILYKLEQRRLNELNDYKQFHNEFFALKAIFVKLLTFLCDEKATLNAGYEKNENYFWNTSTLTLTHRIGDNYYGSRADQFTFNTIIYNTDVGLYTFECEMRGPSFMRLLKRYVENEYPGIYYKASPDVRQVVEGHMNNCWILRANVETEGYKPKIPMAVDVIELVKHIKPIRKYLYIFPGIGLLYDNHNERIYPEKFTMQELAKFNRLVDDIIKGVKNL